MKLYGFILFLIISNCIIAQNDVERLLSYPLSDREMSEVLAREEFLNTHKFNSPWLRDLDFRIRSNDKEVGLEDYRLRFTLLNPVEMDRNRDYRKLLLSQQSFERKKTINDVMLRRYELLIESHFLEQNFKIKEKYLLNLKDIRSIVMAELFDLGDVVNLEQEMTRIEFQLADLKQKSDIIGRLLSSYELENFPDWSQFPIISIQQISFMLKNNMNDSVSMRVIAKNQKLEESSSIMAIKKAESFSNIGYFQAEYDKERGNVWDEHVGFQIGITIPIFNSNKPDLQRRELELLEDAVDLNQTISVEKEQNDLEVVRINDLISQGDLIKEKINSLNDLKKLINETDSDINGFKRIADYDLFLNEKQISTFSDIRMRFVKLLHTYGRLADQPYTNFLSNDLTTFDISQ
ncbi:MAG: hypothetical protein ACJA08_001413 [Cyclobacteriaceae bacterium]|jgi:hypothetical protein